MIVKLLTEYHLEFLGSKKAAEARLSLHLSNCWKSHAAAQIQPPALATYNRERERGVCNVLGHMLLLVNS